VSNKTSLLLHEGHLKSLVAVASVGREEKLEVTSLKMFNG
jgi:hypothetical protein